MRFFILCCLFLSLNACQTSKNSHLFAGINTTDKIVLSYQELGLNRELIIKEDAIIKKLYALDPYVIMYCDWQKYATTPFGNIKISVNGKEAGHWTILHRKDFKINNEQFEIFDWIESITPENRINQRQF